MGTYIPQQLDSRRLILGFVIEEFIMIIVPTLIGFVGQHASIGFIISFLGLFAIRIVKRLVVNWSYQGWLYRNLPTFDKRLPPSCWRRVGG